MSRTRALLVLPLLLAATLAGCATDTPDDDDTPVTTTPSGTPTSTPPTTTPTPGARTPGAYEALGFDGDTWPRLDGVTLTILDHGAFGAFDDAKKAFENLTGATVEHVEADDTGSALNLAVQEKGDPTFDVIYGIDNVLYARAVDAGIFEPYKPLLADRIASEYVFFAPDGDDAWHATPVDHGTIAINWDPNHDTMQGVDIQSLDDVKEHAGLFVTPDPRTSTPGLGFLLATIATYPEGAEYDWRDYWNDLFANGVLVTSGWTEAYEQHFSAGYGVYYGGAADKPIVTSYTSSPAYEHYFERPENELANVLTAPNSTFRQVQTMGIAKGTPNIAAAQAWIEFTLTDAFQALAAPGNAVYPVVESVSTDDTYGDVDPAPGSFEPAQFDYRELGANLEGWVRAWVDLCEAANCA